MNKKNLRNRIWGIALAVLFLTGITVFSTGSAQAQTRVYRPRVVVVSPYRVYRPYYPFGWRNYYGWNDYGWSNPYSEYVFSNSEKAAQKGFEQGTKTGYDDGKKRKSYSFERSHYYHDAGFGNYAEVYRRNFARGYQSGYRSGIERAS